MLGGTFDNNIGAWYTNGGEGNIKNDELYELKTGSSSSSLGTSNSIKFTTGKKYRIIFSSKLDKEGYITPFIQHNEGDYISAWHMNGRLLTTSNVSNSTKLEDL